MSIENLYSKPADPVISLGCLKWHEDFEEHDNKGVKLVKPLPRQYQGEAFAPLLGHTIQLPANTEDVASAN